MVLWQPSAAGTHAVSKASQAIAEIRHAKYRGAITVWACDGQTARSEHDQIIRTWADSVWQAYMTQRDGVVDLLIAELGQILAAAALVRAGATFVDGLIIEREDQRYAV